MKIEGNYTIAASRERVWAALNDPEILKATIPRCETMEKVSDTEFSALVVVKVGPFKMPFSGGVLLTNLNPPYSYTISAEGRGGFAGFASGSADVALIDCDEGTKLSYAANANIEGKIATIGSKLIDGTAKKLSDKFFSRFAAAINDSQESIE
jgi:carbon monoxide dehydrogenase subunit G